MAGTSLTNVLQALPYLTSMVEGGGQLISGIVKKRQANKMEIPREDLRYSQLLADIERKRTQLESGYDPTTKMAGDRIGSQLATTSKNIVGRSGGDVGAAMTGLSMAGRQAGEAFNTALAENAKEQAYYTNLDEQMTDKIASRKFDVAMWEKLQKMRESAENTKAGFANFNGGLTRLSSLFAKDKKVGTGSGLPGGDPDIPEDAGLGAGMIGANLIGSGVAAGANSLGNLMRTGMSAGF